MLNNDFWWSVRRESENRSKLTKVGFSVWPKVVGYRSRQSDNCGHWPFPCGSDKDTQLWMFCLWWTRGGVQRADLKRSQTVCSHIAMWHAQVEAVRLQLGHLFSFSAPLFSSVVSPSTPCQGNKPLCQAVCSWIKLTSGCDALILYPIVTLSQTFTVTQEHVALQMKLKLVMPTVTVMSSTSTVCSCI